MRYKKITAIVVATLIVVIAAAGCLNTEATKKPVDAVEISQAEEKIIESMLAEGKDEMEIAEALIAYESEVMATAETSGTTTGANGETEAPTETTAWERVINGKTVRVTPTPTTGTSATSGTTTGTSATQSTIPTNGNPTGTNGTSATTTSGTTAAPTETTVKPTETTAATTKDYEFKSSLENECIDLINALRKQRAYDKGKTYYVPIVKTSDALSKTHTRCIEISSNFSHNSASGISLGSECIYQIGTSSTSASTIVNAWKNSSAHYACLMTGVTASGEASENGAVGVMVVGNTTYAVFGITGCNAGEGLSSGYVDPTETTAKPTETTVAPTETTAKPTETTAAPTETTAAPTETTAKPTETTAPPPETAAPKPTEKPDPCANGHDWDNYKFDDEYDYYRCTRCGAEKKEPI
ncbi:MAG: hypothetical protein K5875_03010 [Saccharofermentans sp.]|nr:hypothetical protein [Saccharofermentans sp.]